MPLSKWERLFVALGAAVMLIGVGAGAFGAHALAPYFETYPNLKGTYETAVRYQLIHGLALFVVAWTWDKLPIRLASWAGVFFAAGILLFSGSLYLLVLTRATWLGAITPIGGVAFLAGWLFILFAAIRYR